MSAANWYADPTGRHAQRYWDGQRWTGHVAGADGVQAEDSEPVDPATPPPGTPTAAAPAPAPAPQPSAAAPAPGQVHENWSPPTGAAAAPAAVGTTSSSSGPAVSAGLIVSAVGAIATLVAVFVLDWIDVGIAGGLSGEGGGIGDIDDILGLPGFSPDVLFLSEWFFSFGWIVALLAAVAAVVTSFVSAIKVPVAAVCALCAAWAVVATFDVASTLEDDFGMGTSFDPAIGLWVGAAGLVVAAVGALISKPATK